MKWKMKIAIRAAVVVAHKDKLLLVKHRKGNEEYWVLPGGHVEAGETVLCAAYRELEEELRIRPKIIKVLFFDEVIVKRRKKHVVDIVYLAQARTADFDLNIAEAVVDARYFSFSGLLKIDLRPPTAAFLIALKKNNFKSHTFFAGSFVG